MNTLSVCLSSRMSVSLSQVKISQISTKYCICQYHIYHQNVLRGLVQRAVLRSLPCRFVCFLCDGFALLLKTINRRGRHNWSFFLTFSCYYCLLPLITESNFFFINNKKRNTFVLHSATVNGLQVSFNRPYFTVQNIIVLILLDSLLKNIKEIKKNVPGAFLSQLHFFKFLLQAEGNFLFGMFFY